MERGVDETANFRCIGEGTRSRVPMVLQGRTEAVWIPNFNVVLRAF